MGWDRATTTDEVAGSDPPHVRVLGPCALSSSERVPSPIQRRMLARLAAAGGQPVPIEVLAEAAWPGEIPRTAKAALLNQVSRIRASYGDDIIATTSDGYALAITTDLDLVADEVRRAERAVLGGEFDTADRVLTGALARWSGRVFGDLDHVEEVEPGRRRAAELRHAAENVRLVAALRSGRVAFAVPEAERLVAHAPYDEQRWVLLAESLDLAGRRGDALAALDRARRSLRDGLGLDAGPVLRAAEASLFGVGLGSSRLTPRRVVGRDAVLLSLETVALAGQCAMLRGEVGVGVSTVLAESARRLRRRSAVAHTRCAAAPSAPLSTVADLLEQLGPADAGVMPVVEQFVSIVRRLGTAGPVVLVVDDLHLAGPSTVDALRTVAAIESVSIVAAAREPVAGLEPDGTAGWQFVEIAPLDARAVAELVPELAGDTPVPPGHLEWLTEMSGGNPLFLESLIEARGVSADVDESGIAPSPVPTLRLPEALSRHVRVRLDRLGPTTRQALEVAAVAGPELPMEILDELAPASGTASAFAVGLLVRLPGRRAQFRHGAVQRVVLADMPTGRRTELHHAIGGLLAARGHPPGPVAQHLLAAVEVDPAAALVAGRSAAAAATRSGAHRDAAEWLRRVADVAATMGELGERELVTCLIERGDALRLAGDPVHGSLLSDAVERAFRLGDPELVASAAFAVLQLGFTTAVGTAHEVGETVADRALSIAAGADGRARVAAAASLGLSMTGAAERCRELFASALDEPVSERVRRQILPFAYMALGMPDDLELREALSEELLRLGEAAGDPAATFEARHLGFSVALQRGDGVAVRRHLDQMVELVDQVGDVGRRWAVLYQMAAVAHLDDDLDRSETLSDDALATFATVSPTRAFAAHGGQLLAIRQAQGRLGELTETFDHLVTEQPEIPAWHAALALSLVDVDPDRAAAHARTALRDVPCDFLWLAAHVIGGRAAAAAGDPHTLEQYADRLAPWTGRSCWQGTCSYGPVDTVLALLHRRLGRAGAADAHARRARALAQRLGGQVFIRDLVELGFAEPSPGGGGSSQPTAMRSRERGRRVGSRPWRP